MLTIVVVGELVSDPLETLRVKLFLPMRRGGLDLRKRRLCSSEYPEYLDWTSHY